MGEFSSNILVNYYHETNLVSGHDRGCAFGAGADCSCSKGLYNVFVIYLMYDPAELDHRFPIECGTDAKEMNAAAAKWRKRGFRIRYTCEKFHTSDFESWEALNETCLMSRRGSYSPDSNGYVELPNPEDYDDSP